MQRPTHFIAIIGPQLSGKSSFARELQNRVRHRLPIIDCDKYRDAGLLTAHIKGWKTGSPQAVPEYYVRGQIAGVITRAPAPVMIIDGVTDPEIIAQCTVSLLITCPGDQRLARFIEKALINIPPGREVDVVMAAMRAYFADEAKFLRDKVPRSTAWIRSAIPPASLIDAINQMNE